MMTVLQNRKPDGSLGERKEDREFWAWFDYWTTKYKLFIWLCGVLAAAGFGIKLPVWTANQTKAKIDSSTAIMQRQIDAVKQEHIIIHTEITNTIQPEITAVKDDLNILLRMACNDKYSNDHDKSLSGLKCYK